MNQASIIALLGIVFLIVEAAIETLMYTHSLISPTIFLVSILVNDVSTFFFCALSYHIDDLVEISSSSSELPTSELTDDIEQTIHQTETV